MSLDPYELVPGDLVAARVRGVWGLTRVRGSTQDPSTAAVVQLGGVLRVHTAAGMIRATDLDWPDHGTALPTHPDRWVDLDAEPQRLIRRAGREPVSRERVSRRGARGYTREP